MDEGMPPFDQYQLSALENKRITRPEPEGSRDHERVETLRGARDWLEGKVRGELKERLDGEGQLDHLRAGEKNTRLIYKDLVGRDLTEFEELQISLFEWGHDEGKWAVQEVVDYYKTDEGQAVIATMGLSEGERSILKKGVEAANPRGYTSQQDIAHHLFSGVLLTKYFNTQAEFQKLSDQDKQTLLNAVLGHQFKGYYSREARKLGYDNAEIVAISRRQTLDLAMESAGAYKLLDQESVALQDSDWEKAAEVRKRFNETQARVISELDDASVLAAAAKDGDILNMDQLGEVDKEGKFHAGGYLKIVGINVTHTMRGINRRSLELNDCFESANQSVADVSHEVVTPMGHNMAAVWEDQCLTLQKLIDGAGWSSEVDDYLLKLAAGFGRPDIGLDKIRQTRRQVKLISELSRDDTAPQGEVIFKERMLEVTKMLRSVAELLVRSHGAINPLTDKITNQSNGYEWQWGDVGM